MFAYKVILMKIRITSTIESATRDAVSKLAEKEKRNFSQMVDNILSRDSEVKKLIELSKKKK